jgi:hypothetical protein
MIVTSAIRGSGAPTAITSSSSIEAFPLIFNLLQVLLGPFYDYGEVAPTQSAAMDLERFDKDKGFMVGCHSVKVWRVIIVGEHLDLYASENYNGRHAGPFRHRSI